MVMNSLFIWEQLWYLCCKKIGKFFPPVICTSQLWQHLASGKGCSDKLLCCVPQPHGRRALGARWNANHVYFQLEHAQVPWAIRKGVNCMSAGPGGAKPCQPSNCCWCFSCQFSQNQKWVKTPLYVEEHNCIPNCCQTGTKTAESLIIKVTCKCYRKKNNRCTK